MAYKYYQETMREVRFVFFLFYYVVQSLGWKSHVCHNLVAIFITLNFVFRNLFHLNQTFQDLTVFVDFASMPDNVFLSKFAFINKYLHTFSTLSLTNKVGPFVNVHECLVVRSIPTCSLLRSFVFLSLDMIL